MEVIEVVRSWVGVATTWMVEVLGLATREDVVELRRRTIWSGVNLLVCIVPSPSLVGERIEALYASRGGSGKR